MLRIYFLQKITGSVLAIAVQFRDYLEMAISWPILSADVSRM